MENRVVMHKYFGLCRVNGVNERGKYRLSPVQPDAFRRMSRDGHTIMPDFVLATEDHLVKPDFRGAHPHASLAFDFAVDAVPFVAWTDCEYTLYSDIGTVRGYLQVNGRLATVVMPISIRLLVDIGKNELIPAFRHQVASYVAGLLQDDERKE